MSVPWYNETRNEHEVHALTDCKVFWFRPGMYDNPSPQLDGVAHFFACTKRKKHIISYGCSCSMDFFSTLHTFVPPYAALSYDTAWLLFMSLPCTALKHNT